MYSQHAHGRIHCRGLPALAPRVFNKTSTCVQIALPTWGCLDEKSSWREFAEGADDDAIAAAVAAFQPEAALGVDWHSLGAWQRLQQHHLSSRLVPVPFFYLNYRRALANTLHANCALLHVHGMIDVSSKPVHAIPHRGARTLVLAHATHEAEH
jgi:hypothetical protein